MAQMMLEAALEIVRMTMEDIDASDIADADPDKYPLQFADDRIGK